MDLSGAAFTFSKTTLDDVLARYSVKAEGSASTTNKTPASVKTAVSTASTPASTATSRTTSAT